MRKLLLISAFVFASAVSAPQAFAATCVVDTDVSGGAQLGIGYGPVGNTNGTWIAASFTPASNCQLGLVSAGVSKVGSPAGLDGAIYSDAAGNPNTALTSFVPFDITGVSICAADNAFYDFAGSITLTGGTKYHLVLRNNGVGGSSNRWNWCGHTSPDNATENDSGSWFDGGAALSLTVNEFSGGGGGSGTSSSTMQYVDNPNQDTMNIVVLFMMSAWGAVWLFRKRN